MPRGGGDCNTDLTDRFLNCRDIKLQDLKTKFILHKDNLQAQ